METPEYRIGWREAMETATRVLERAGAPPAHARIQADLLVEAEARGRSSHGLLRLPRVVERIRNGVADPRTRGAATWRGDALLCVDGERGLGPVVAFAALDQIAERARRTGVAAAAIHHNNHLGMLALYAERIAEQGQVLLAMTTSEALVHPWGGRRAMLGTNPVAIGVPASPVPFVLDMATSLVSMGQIHDHAHRQRPLPPGWALDELGDPTTDAARAKHGAIAPFGGAKGYALGLAFEVMIASLTASALGTQVQGTLDSTLACNKGDVFIVMEPAPGGVGDAISAYLDAIRSCASADPDVPVAVPGDRALRCRARSIDEGMLIAAQVWDRIRSLAGLSHDQEGI
ncbi:dehydrogenase [Burkholderia sp. WAC0059]|uniref:Ldh family oxidoreductase n=1 Tax=Burkholderia sp. WAC0059 TaxID=2066022 RepID=UPI000C7F7951|nr:Ldh family oxidoreductase [Burkholderia sp. WAC0059]PLZ01387.1 dehydrogenase [Burkholderia sp. WAC0059]